MALGWLAGLIFYLLAWRWALATIARFEDLSILAASPFFVLFAAYHATQLALFALPIPKIHADASRAHAPLLLACWWVVLEWSFPRVMPWHLGDALAPAPWLRQFADVGGPYGLSFLIVLVNALIATALAPQTRGRRDRVVSGGSALLIILRTPAFRIRHPHAR